MDDRVLITGGKGMLAHSVREALRARGKEAVALDLPEIDITRADSLRAAFTAHRPSVVFNCAAFTNVDRCEQQEQAANAVNGHAVGELARICRELNAFLVHLSTDFVFDGRATRPYRPDDVPSPLSAYGRSKLLGEQLVREHAAPAQWLLVRTAWLYGPRGANFPRTIVERARSGAPLKVVCDQTGSPTYAPDLADAMLGLVDRGAHGIVHVTNSGQTTWYNFARAALEIFDVKADVEPITAADWARIRPEAAARPAYSVLDLSEFARLVGRSMRPWNEALREYKQSVDRDGF